MPELNVDLLTKIRNELVKKEGQKFVFDMNYFVRIPEENVKVDGGHVEPSLCGTQCCIAGLATILGNPASVKEKFSKELESGHLYTNLGHYHLDNEIEARKLLGLSIVKSHQLFYGNLPNGQSIDLETIKPEHAVTVIDHLIETGKVDWSLVEDEYGIVVNEE